MSRDTRMRNDDLALCTWCLVRNISETVRDRDLGPIGPPIGNDPSRVQWSRERSRSWTQYVWCPLSRKWLEIANWWQWGAYRKWGPGNRIVTWPMTSRDPERSRSWPQYIWCPLSRKRWRWRLGDNGVLIRNWPLGIELPRDRWRHVTPKGQGRDLDMFGAHYLGNGGDGDLMTMERL